MGFVQAWELRTVGGPTNDFKQTLREPRLQARTVYPLIGGFDLRRIDSQSVRKYFFYSISANVRTYVRLYVYMSASTFLAYMKVRYL